jgi:carbamoyl-phosphate synthase small subunit
MYAVLALADGTVMEGAGFGAEGRAEGEVVFNTSLVGYEESITDPSYKGQILTFTYPLIGNYGVRAERLESDRIQVEGLVVRELCDYHQHRDSARGLEEFLVEQGISGIEGVDTRSLTRRIRVHGVINGALWVSSRPIDTGEVLKAALDREDISSYDLVGLVSTREPVVYGKSGRKTVALIDCGVKHSIIRSLLKRDINVCLYPHTVSPEEVEERGLDGMLVSNGPGDPERVESAIHLVRELRGKYPIFGICLGHQIISLALGGRTYKLKFGHRGTNQPVKDLKGGRTFITSQNHGFAVDRDSLQGTGLRVTHVNLNDGSVEGVEHESLPIYGFQAHPEANPGPWDMDNWFDMMAEILHQR